MARELHIPACEGRHLHLPKGAELRIVDPEGQQVADFWAFPLDAGGKDWLSTSQTRDVNERLFPAIGQHFHSDRGVPLLTLIEDSSPSPHDMLFPACNPALYVRAGLAGHPNCRDNLLAAVREAGMSISMVPDPVNFFQRSLPSGDGRLDVLASDNPPGGSVVLRAETDLLVVVTACAVDFHPTNGGRCTGIVIVTRGGRQERGPFGMASA